LWWSSLLLAGVAISWMTGLVVARVFRDRSDARQARDRTTVQRAFQAIMYRRRQAALRLYALRHRPRLMAETLLETLAFVRGAEREELISALVGLDVDACLRDRLSWGSNDGRMLCAESLAAFPGDKTVITLRQLMSGPSNADLRVAVIRTLIELGASPPVAEVLATLRLCGAAESVLFLPVVRRLAIADPSSAVAALTDVSLGAGVRAALVDALGHSGDYRAIDLLRTVSTDRSELVRIAAVRALGALSHPAAETLVVAAFEDSVWEVRAAACEAAARIGLPHSIPALVLRLADPIWSVRFQAADSLTAMGDAGLRSLRLAAQSNVDNARRAASMALAEKGIRDIAEA
jgi:HEAT repeat protein